MPPIIAIIGRTNVGKSALFNRLVGQRRTVVEDFPGVTRDRVYAEVDLDGRVATLVDTGGLVGAESDALIGQVKEQAARALAEADVLLLLFDGQEGIVSLDHEVAEAARRSGKPVVAVVNKMESGRGDVTQFAELGFGLPLPISALHGQGLSRLEDALRAALPSAEDTGETPVPAGAIPLAIVGRPNVGKSALVNALLGQPRMIVSEIPGTTRDTVDTLLQIGEQRYQLVDTPGLRRRGKRSQGVEFYSSIRSIRALQRAEVGVVVFDAGEGLTQQDAAIALEVDTARRPLIMVANKWDLVRERAFGEVEGGRWNMERGEGRAESGEGLIAPAPLSLKERQRAEGLLKKDFEALARGRLKFAGQAPLVYTCALTGEGVEQILPLAAQISTQYRRRLETGVLNRALAEAMDKHNPPSRGGRQLRIYYATQAQAAPPTFVLFVNDPRLMHFSYERYLLNFLREKFDLRLVPLTLRVRESRGRRGD
jgi:GTP-binding protein